MVGRALLLERLRPLQSEGRSTRIYVSVVHSVDEEDTHTLNFSAKASMSSAKHSSAPLVMSAACVTSLNFVHHSVEAHRGVLYSSLGAEFRKTSDQGSR